MNTYGVFSYALRVLGKRRSLYFWIITLLRGVVALLDVLGLVVLGLAATLLAQSVKGEFVSIPALDGYADFIGEFFSNFERASLVFNLGILVVLFFLLKGMLSYVLGLTASRFLARCETSITRVLATDIFRLDGQPSRKSPEQISYSLTFGTAALVSRGLGSISTLVSEFFALTFTIALLLVVQPITTLLAIMYLGLVSLILATLIGRKIQIFGQTSTNQINLANRSVRDVLATQRERFLSGRLGESVDSIAEIKLQSAQALGQALQYSLLPRYVIESSFLLGAFAMAAYQFRTSDWVSASTSVALFMAAGSRIAPSGLAILSSLNTLRQVTPDAQMAKELFQNEGV